MHAVSRGHMKCILVARVRAGAEVITFPSARIYGKTKNMRKSIKVGPKRRGRPATGRDPVMGLRMSPNLKGAIVKWAENQPDKPKLSEATRRLVEIGLAVKTRSVPSERQRAAFADLASKAIDSLTAAIPDNDEKASRKRRLIKRPEEFREVRVDRPKPHKG